MPFLMRGIKKTRWRPDAEQPWLPKNEPGADSLADLQTKDNELSVWWVDDDQSNLERVITALASTKDTLSLVDYRLVPIARVRQSRFEIVQTPGKSHDEEANVRWHRDIQFLSAERLLSLSRCLWRHGQSARCREPKVRDLLRAAIAQGRLDRDHLKPGLVAKLNLD